MFNCYTQHKRQQSRQRLVLEHRNILRHRLQYQKYKVIAEQKYHNRVARFMREMKEKPLRVQEQGAGVDYTVTRGFRPKEEEGREGKGLKDRFRFRDLEDWRSVRGSLERAGEIASRPKSRNRPLQTISPKSRIATEPTYTIIQDTNNSLVKIRDHGQTLKTQEYTSVDLGTRSKSTQPRPTRDSAISQRQPDGRRERECPRHLRTIERLTSSIKQGTTLSKFPKFLPYRPRTKVQDPPPTTYTQRKYQLGESSHCQSKSIQSDQYSLGSLQHQKLYFKDVISLTNNPSYTLNNTAKEILYLCNLYKYKPKNDTKVDS